MDGRTVLKVDVCSLGYFRKGLAETFWWGVTVTVIQIWMIKVNVILIQRNKWKVIG